MKTAGIPIWVTIFAIIVFIAGSGLGIMALTGNGMEPHMNVSWGGRNLGLGLAAGVAVWLKSPIAYIAAFVGGLARELSDLIMEFGKAEPNMGMVGFIVVFMLLGIAGIYYANSARNLRD